MLLHMTSVFIIQGLRQKSNVRKQSVDSFGYDFLCGKNLNFIRRPFWAMAVQFHFDHENGKRKTTTLNFISFVCACLRSLLSRWNIIQKEQWKLSVGTVWLFLFVVIFSSSPKNISPFSWLAELDPRWSWILKPKENALTYRRQAGTVLYTCYINVTSLKLGQKYARLSMERNIYHTTYKTNI